MIVGASLRALARRRTRTLLALLGIAVSAALLIDMTMLAGGLTRSFSELTRARGFGIRVTPAGTLPFDSEAGIHDAGRIAREILDLPGVTAVAPVLGAQLYLAGAAEEMEPVFSVGVDPAAQMLYLLLSGDDPRPGEIVVSRPLADARGLTVGDSLVLSARLDVTFGTLRDGRVFRVAGIGDFLYDYAGQRSLAIEISEVQAMTGRADEVSLFAVAATPDADEESLTRVIESSFPGVSAYGTAALMEAMDERLSYFRQLSTILGAIALGVALLLAGTVVTIGVRERFHEIATLRAIGVSGRRLQLAIAVEGLTLTSIGCAIGLPLGFWMARRLDAILLSFPGIPARVSFFVFDPVDAGFALATVIVGGGLSGLIPGLAALRAPLGNVLREESD